MRNLTLFFLLIFAFTSCETDQKPEIVSEDLIDARFQTCYFENDFAKNRCDSVLSAYFGANNFSNLKLNKSESFIGCDENEELSRLTFGDENCCVPRTYDLIYDIKIDGKVIYQIPMVAGSDMKFDFISLDIKEELEGYKLLLDGKLKINYAEAQIIAIENGVDLDESMLELVKDEKSETTGADSYYWEAIAYEDKSFVTLTIDALSGETRKEVLTAVDGPRSH